MLFGVVDIVIVTDNIKKTYFCLPAWEEAPHACALACTFTVCSAVRKNN